MQRARDGARHKISMFQHRGAELLEVTSEEASKRVQNESLDIVFVDGDHSYTATLRDLELWYPKIRKGGVLSGHDFGSNPEVTRAVIDFRKSLFVGLDRTDVLNSPGLLYINVDADWTWFFTKM